MQLFESFAGHCSQAEAVSSFGVLLEILRPSSPFFFVSAAVWVGSQRGLKPPSACISELQDRATVRAGSSRTRALRRWGWSLCFPGRVRSLFRVLQLLSWCWYKEHSCASIKGRVRKHHKIYIYISSLWEVGPSCWVLLHNTLGWKHERAIAAHPPFVAAASLVWASSLQDTCAASAAWEVLLSALSYQSYTS